MIGSEPWPDDYFEQAQACLYCGSLELTPAIAHVQDWFFGAVPGEFSFSRCDQCRSLVLDRRPRAEQVWRAYDSYYTHERAAGVSAGTSMAKKVWRNLRQSYVDAVIAQHGSAVDHLKSAIIRAFPSRQREIDVSYRFIPSPKARVLDYGCGNGDFLQRAHDIGCETVGVEADPDATKIAEARGLMVLAPDDVAAMGWRQRFDLITLNHVIEHLAQPVGLLRKCREWLAPGGSIFLEAPNAEARGLTTFGRFWRGLEAPRHFGIPSEKGLRLALEQAGFKPPTMIQRTFVAQAMDLQSARARQEFGASSERADRQPVLRGPEFLTMLVQPIG